MKRVAMALALAGAPLAASAAEGARVEVRGEIIDTWCYYSGVMGGPEAVVGSAHHTCALWCSAGGIPVGLLAEDGTVYMVLKLGGQGTTGNPTQMRLASHEVTADGILYERDGLKYLIVEEVVTDHGITNPNHEDFGPVPGFAIPEPQE
ncbi:hypothetical protein [Roseovarius aestuariivivens]|uniref:hypothetical protein n=1 Tax=Roseovarius aestuariivivens TaxID=1888910 RepID=UPI001081FDB2|nr:hypothetical protein [Roseovarius aestuariivivens]